MKIEATQDELQALAGLIDAALRQTGIRGAKDAALWIDKIEAALGGSNDETVDENV